MSYRANITVQEFSKPDRNGRQSLLVEWTDCGGRRRGQAYFADPAKVVARLRHNIAGQFWFDYRRGA